VRKADNLPPSCAVVTKSGNLKFVEPSGSVQVCNGNVLPFTRLAEDQFVVSEFELDVHTHSH
jgi:hypothetical protein